MMHENDAAEVLYRMAANEHMHPSDVKEGKIEAIADTEGLLKVDREKLKKVNAFGEMMIATRHGNTVVKKGDKLAGTRIIPLVIKKDKMQEAEKICDGTPILKILPFTVKKQRLSQREMKFITAGSKMLLRRSLSRKSQNLGQK